MNGRGRSPSTAMVGRRTVCCATGLPSSLSDLAAAVNVHTVHLARVFRVSALYGRRLHLRQLRIEYASRRLSMADDSLVEIALAAGLFRPKPFFQNL